MKIRSKSLSIIVLSTFIIGIALSMAFNLWKTESTKTPAKFSSGKFEGMFNPADIRGSYTFGDISSNFNIPVETLAGAFGIVSDDEAAFQVKELEEMYEGVNAEGEIGTDSVRIFAALYAGLPYEPEETSLLPNQAIGFLKDKLSQEELEALKSISVNISEIKYGAGPAAAEESDREAEQEGIIKGKTTFKDLLDFGLSKTDIEEVMGLKMGPTSMAVRDFAADSGLEYSIIRAALQEKLDVLK